MQVVKLGPSSWKKSQLNLENVEKSEKILANSSFSFSKPFVSLFGFFFIAFRLLLYVVVSSVTMQLCLILWYMQPGCSKETP